MARTVVLIFLLDTLPEFPIILNQTLQDTSKLPGSLDNTIQECNTNIAYSVLQKANQEIDKNNPNWKLFKAKDDPFKELSKLPPDSVYNEDTVFDNSIPDSDENSIEKTQFHSEQNDIGKQKNFSREVNGNVTKSPPFLVAIFETLSNVTAQTCAGTLLSAHWVVTAASCVGILGEFYKNGTKKIERSRYTIVAGSTNPFVDGSIHNVSEILLHPQTEHKNPFKNSSSPYATNDLQKNSLSSYGGNLAMMKISPGLEVEKIKILENKEDISSATIFGWTPATKETSQDIMVPTSLPVKLTTINQCRPKGSGLASSSALCFNPERMAAMNSTKLGMGGPVLVHSQMLGVVLDDRVPLLVEPLAAHAWIHALINTDAF
ncbi:hypothetical protein ABMA28_016624 [Loxostege sticticalis]|uniref:Peptidase S1 domain-containing protein n=1 Tax=Loxostege sticticalis TaxID=481309 RepID=A0ABD0T6W9_LOXSC